MKNFSLLVALPLIFATEEQISQVAKLTDESKGYRLDEEVADGVTPFAAVTRASIKAGDNNERELEDLLDTILKDYSVMCAKKLGINIGRHDVISFKLSDHFDPKPITDVVKDTDEFCKSKGFRLFSEVISENDMLSDRLSKAVDLNIYSTHATAVAGLLDVKDDILEEYSADVISEMDDAMMWVMLAALAIGDSKEKE